MEKAAAGHLLLIGGAEDKSGDCLILREFLRLTQRQKAQSSVLILSTASEEAEDAGADYARLFRELGATEVEVLALQRREEAERGEAAAQVARAGGIFFTGGDQLRITSLLGGTRVDEALHQAYREGVVIAGTSAGAAAMSSTMIVGGGSAETPRWSAVNLAPGMGFLTGAVIDQHFTQRGRIGRLLLAVAQNPYTLGIGIDEDTALLLPPDGRALVLGSRTVTLIDARGSTFVNVSELKPDEALALFGATVHVLPSGYGFSLATRTPFSVGHMGAKREWK